MAEPRADSPPPTFSPAFLSSFAYTPSPRRSQRATSTPKRPYIDHGSSSEPEEPTATPKAKRYRVPLTPGPPNSKKRKTTASAFPSVTAAPKKAKAPKKNGKSGYSPPEQYADYMPVVDHVGPQLDVLFSGINPGLTSSATQHHFAHPTNHFYKCLHRGGFTPKLIPPTEDHTLPARFNIGLTNLAGRPTNNASELSASEKRAAVPELLAKLSLYQPHILCLVGKSIWQSIEGAVRTASSGAPAPRGKAGGSPAAGKGKAKAKAKTPEKGKGKGKEKEKEKVWLEADEKTGFRVREYKMVHPDTGRETIFFVVPSTSGLVQTYQLPTKARAFAACRETLELIKAGKYDTSAMRVIDFDAVYRKAGVPRPAVKVEVGVKVEEAVKAEVEMEDVKPVLKTEEVKEDEEETVDAEVERAIKAELEEEVMAEGG